ncbi:MAG: NAD-dependent epimerase/dehydratase family protein [Opitutaceae bacterium]|nr:NAD-dependent epimerase/dehydratase family protein [Opitutaceae bacterium]
MCAGSSSPARKIALIGATGFIGRRVAAHLLARGDDVLALVRPESRHRDALPPGVRSSEVRLDPADPRLAAALGEADAVIYAAGAVRGRDLADFLPANVRGVEAVAAVLGALTPPRPLILLSSLAASEPGLSPYARSKRMGELVLAGSPGRLPWTILRPTALYGPGDRELRPLLALMRRGWLLCPAGPLQRLSFLEVDDLARALLAALDHPEAVRHRTYSLDDGRPGGYDRSALAASLRPHGRMHCVRVPRAVLSLAAHMNRGAARLLGYAPMLTPGKVGELTHPSWIGDNGPFTAATGWRPQSDLAAGTRALFGPV